MDKTGTFAEKMAGGRVSTACMNLTTWRGRCRDSSTACARPLPANRSYFHVSCLCSDVHVHFLNGDGYALRQKLSFDVRFGDGGRLLIGCVRCVESERQQPELCVGLILNMISRQVLTICEVTHMRLKPTPCTHAPMFQLPHGMEVARQVCCRKVNPFRPAKMQRLTWNKLSILFSMILFQNLVH